MADFNYHLPDGWDALYFGVRLGLGFNSGSSNDVIAPISYSSTNLAYGVVGGYDYKVSESFTIGPRVSYTAISRDAGNMGDFQAQAAFKYFFN
jgi:opacity protein-like surface antigen